MSAHSQVPSSISVVVQSHGCGSTDTMSDSSLYFGMVASYDAKV